MHVTGGLQLRVCQSIHDVPRAAWDALLDERAMPFLRWDWLASLEESGCVTPRRGWRPRHLAVWRGERLVAAAPAYLSESSDGDFSRDWDWASAVERAGVHWYPKLCLTVPFTPATGRRLLVAQGEDRAACVAALLGGARQLAEEERLTTVQVLFPDPEEVAELEQAGWAIRLSYQYHWRNAGYREPEDFLARLDSKRRNQHKRERAAPASQGITIRTVRGEELAADAVTWARTAFALHHATVEKLPWGRGWLNQRFYELVMTRMPEAVEVVAAWREGRVIAGAFNMASRTHLYGRYWGCFEEHRFLHFNVCFYHSIDECIVRGLEVFEGGAGGEHKIVRGFEPAETYSAHLFLEPRVDAALRRHLVGETAELRMGLERWRTSAPILKPKE
jgi:hypothetical protein